VTWRGRASTWGLAAALLLGAASALAIGLGGSPDMLGQMVPFTSQQPVPDDATLSERLHGRAPLTWVFVGDSITQGLEHTHGRRSFVEHFAERTRGELGRFGDVVVNTGISGDRTEDVLAGFPARVERFHPDVVVVMLGTNDSVRGPGGVSGFRRRLGEIVARVRDLHAVPVLQTPPAADVEASPEHADLAAYADTVREVADTRNVVLVDHFAHWLESGHGAPPPAWLDDPIHPNARGHLEMARTLFRRLGVFDPDSPTGGAPWGGPREASGQGGHSKGG
jgi:acyl-CoA thioesterase I